MPQFIPTCSLGFLQAEVELAPVFSSSLHCSVILPCQLCSCSASDLGIFLSAFCLFFSSFPPLLLLGSGYSSKQATLQSLSSACLWDPWTLASMGLWTPFGEIEGVVLSHCLLHKCAEKKITIFPQAPEIVEKHMQSQWGIRTNIFGCYYSCQKPLLLFPSPLLHKECDTRISCNVSCGEILQMAEETHSFYESVEKSPF